MDRDKMKICAVIAEYNPFHNGHKYHIEKTRELFGATHIVAVMSGNFTQRGDVAVYDKHLRARAALENGVDLVIELPVQYALGSAEQFAMGAVSLIESLGCVDMLSFGSECGDIKLLTETAGAVLYIQEKQEFFDAMQTGLSFPAALQKTIEKYYENDVVDTLTDPNNTLAVEYLKALGEVGSQIKPVTVRRFGSQHDASDHDGTYASASLIRKYIREGNYNEINSFTPCADAFRGVPFADISEIETAILSKLRTMTPHQLAKAPNVLMGLENRIYKAARVSTSLAELFGLIKTKRYTMARIRRIILCEYLGIRRAEVNAAPVYVRVLGMNGRGKEILSAANCSLPIDTSLRALSLKGKKERRSAKLSATADDLYALAFREKKVCGLDYTTKPVILP